MAANQLGDLLAQLPVADPASESWRKIEATAQDLANNLRVRDGTYCSRILVCIPRFRFNIAFL